MARRISDGEVAIRAAAAGAIRAVLRDGLLVAADGETWAELRAHVSRHCVRG